MSLSTGGAQRCARGRDVRPVRARDRRRAAADHRVVGRGRSCRVPRCSSSRWRWRAPPRRATGDMDAIGTPVISATADISTLTGAAARRAGPWATRSSTPVLGVLLIAAAIAATIYGVRHPSPLARRIVLESSPVLGYAAVMGVLAGTVLETRLDTLIDDPALLVAIPPFIASSGALGGILSARLSSQLHVGLLQPARVPGQARGAGRAGMIMLLGVGRVRRRSDWRPAWARRRSGSRRPTRCRWSGAVEIGGAARDDGRVRRRVLRGDGVVPVRARPRHVEHPDRHVGASTFSASSVSSSASAVVGL